MKITKVIGYELYDSRGWPTVACDIILENGHRVSAIVPSGASKSSYEAYEMRDEETGPETRGVANALHSINVCIAPALVDQEPDGVETDLLLLNLDGTANKRRLGANAMLAVSMACYRAQAYINEMELFEFIAQCCGSSSVSLPFPLFNVINGGRHAHNNLTMQEFMIIPVGMSDFHSAMRTGAMAFHELENMLTTLNLSICVGDEGGIANAFSHDEEALALLTTTLDIVESKGFGKTLIGLDIAASQYYDAKNNIYTIGGRKKTTQELIEWYQYLIDKYPIFSLEDPFAENDVEGWLLCTKHLADKVQIVGDDIFATNPARIAWGVQQGIANAAIIKPNQIGTVTESLQAIQLCKQYGLNTIISHRSGDSEDTFIADLAVGTSAGQCKAGGLTRSEHLCKYNRLLSIENHLSRAAFDL